MTEIERIADQVHRSFWGDAWHGPSVIESLDGVDEILAAAPSPLKSPGSHSIWELIAHLELTQQVVVERIEGRGRLLSDAEYWPSQGESSVARWAALLERLRQGAAVLERVIAAFPSERLDAPLMEGGSTAYNNFIGHAQHNAYHAGQVMVLKKLGRGL